MAIMSVDLREATQKQALTVISEFMPDLGDRFGYQLGYLSGAGDARPVEPFIYEGKAKTLLISCPLFDGFRAAISLKTDVLVKPDLPYSAQFDEWVSQVRSRLAILTMPGEDGQFMVLYVSDHPSDQDHVEDCQYDYQKAFDDISGRFNMVVNDIVTFLTTGAVPGAQ